MGIKIRYSKIYKWNPQEDITSFELAKLIGMFVISEEEQDDFYNQLTEKCKRHILILED